LLEPLCERLRVPADCRDVARLVARFHGDMGKVDELRPDTQLKILERCDALRRPARFAEILGACEADYRGRLGYTERPFAAADQWRAALAAVQSVDAGTIALTCADQAQIPLQIQQARIKALAGIKA